MKTIKCVITPKSVTISDVTVMMVPPLLAEDFSEETSLLRARSEELNEQRIKEMGGRLFQRVFTEAALDRYRSADPAALALVVGGDLALLPWELLHDGANWTARTRGVLRIATTERRSPEILPKPGALKILAAIAGPLLHDNEALPDDDPNQPHPIDVDTHAEVFHKLEEAKFPAEVKLRKHATREILSREVSENYHVLHFVGHGNVGRLVFESRHGIADLAEESWIREQITVALRGGLRLVVINSCFSADACDEMPGVAATILETGVPAVIAMQGSISESADIAFVRNLYDGLGRGKPIDEAVMDARRAMAIPAYAGTRQISAWEWATPVLFINESLLEEEAPLSLIDAEMVEMMAAPKVSIVEPSKASLDPMMTREERFVGRRRELSHVLRSLDPERQDGAQTACLHGDAGMGKTAIAIEAAHRMAEWFDDIVWLTGRTAPPDELREHIRGDDPLARISGAEGLLTALAHRCGFELTGDEEPSQLRDGILKSLRDGRRKLLVLDSMERFVRSDLIRSLLINLPANCKALITSRESLEMDEKQIHVKPMNMLDSALLLIAYSSLKDLKVDTELGEIIHLTGGHPMAMRMVVSQVVTAQKTLGDALKDLRKAKGEIFDYIFKRSLRLAGPNGQKVFAAMAVFFPTASRKALQHICGLSDDDFGKAVKRVVGLSLVESYGQGKRFALHTLARAKAQQQLEGDRDSEKYRERAAQFFMDFVNATAPMTQPAIAAQALGAQDLEGMSRQLIQDAAIEILVKPALEILETELANCLLALERAFGRKDLDMAKGLLGKLGELLIARGHWNVATHYCKRIAEELRDRGECHDEAIALRDLAMMYDRRARSKEAIECYEKALKGARESRDRKLEATILNGLGKVYQRQRNWNEAGKYFEDSRDIFLEIGDELNAGAVLGNLGIVHAHTGRWEEAVQCLETSRKICRQHNDKLREANALTNLSTCYLNRGQEEDAIKSLEESQKIYEDLGYKSEQGDVLNNLGTIHRDRGDLDQAIQYYQRSLIIKREIGDRYGQRMTLDNMALVHSTQGQWMKAASVCLESFQIAVQIHWTVVIDSLRNILEVSKNILRAGEFAIPAQLVQRLSQLIQSAEVADDETRAASAICHGVFTIVGSMAMCECDKKSDVYKEALELARSLDENTGAALKLVEWMEGDEVNGSN